MAAKLAEEPLGATAALLRQRCEVDADAAYGLSVLTARGGDGITRDRKEALRLLIKSAELGKTEAQCQYAQLLAEGAGGVKRDEREACEWLRIADCAEARYRLGLFTFEGRGTRKDPEKAHSLIADAASDGHMAAVDWLHRKDGPSPRRPPPPPSPPPLPRAKKDSGPPSPERVSNDGDALRGALSEARAVAAAARVARTAAEDDAKRLRKERDDFRSKLEQTQRLLEVAKKAPRGDALQRRQQARHAEQLSKLGAAHAAANQALLEKHESTQREAKKHAENCQKLEDEKAAAIAAFDRLAKAADRREKEVARLGSLDYARGLETELEELHTKRDADLTKLQTAWDDDAAEALRDRDALEASLVSQIAQRDLQLLESSSVIDALRSSVDMLDAARAADAASSAVAHEAIVRRAESDVRRTRQEFSDSKTKALQEQKQTHSDIVSELEQAHDKARLADARRRSEISREAERRGADLAAATASLSQVSGEMSRRDQHVNDARDGRRAAEALLRTEVGVCIEEARATGLRMEALLARRRDRERRRARADADARERLVSDYRALADEQAVAVAELERDHRDSSQKLRDALAAEVRRREAAEALVADHAGDVELRDARESELVAARDEIDRLEGELASRNEDDALERTRELLRNAGKNMNALEERRRAEVEALQREVARLGALVEASSSGGDEG